MSRVLPLLLMIAGLCTGCDRSPPQRQEREFAASVLHGLLAYPGSSVVSVNSGVDAAQATLFASAPVDAVATWYRRMLSLNGWELQNDAVTNDGSVSIFALQGTRPLWITLKGTPGRPGTTYTLIGAELPKDSAAQRSGSSMSSNRIQRR